MLKTLSWSYWIRGRLPTEVHRWGREHYIPIKPSELVDQLLKRSANACVSEPSDLASAEEHRAFCKEFKQLGLQMVELVHRRYRRHHERLVDLYALFDPDADMRVVSSIERNEADRLKQDLDCRRLFSEITDSLHHANYRRLKPSEILDALKAASHWGVRLKIRFSAFRRLEVYGRGDIIAKRLKRNWRRFFRMEEVDVPIYQRLVVVFRTKALQSLPETIDPDCVHVRMFKNIPKMDIDMMLPGSQVRLNWADTSKIGIPTMWGVFVLVSKLVKSLWLLALLGALKVLSSFVLLFAIAVASIVYAVKSIFSYSTAKRRHQLNLARNLYYQNLDNNLGALLRLIDEAEQQEACESLLAYYVLHSASPRVLTKEEIDLAAEEILHALVGDQVDFDVRDALRDLAIVGIIHPELQGWKAIQLAEAIEKFETKRW
jgi:hypothetical protein